MESFFLESSDGFHEVVQLMHEKNLNEGKSKPSDRKYYRFLRKCYQVQLKLAILRQIENEELQKMKAKLKAPVTKGQRKQLWESYDSRITKKLMKKYGNRYRALNLD